MGRMRFRLSPRGTWVVVVLGLLSASIYSGVAYALTASVGKPYQGSLVNGIPFPQEFKGYQLRGIERTYTAPEVIGALLDAIENLRSKYPNTCDLYLGDFSLKGGGWMKNHRSHQNGRDVDIGMYAKGNRRLDRFIPMNSANLDVPKTWQLIENLLCSQRVEYIFLDKSVQKLLLAYARSRGKDATYLNRLFGNVRGAVIQHLPAHKDHLHVRFYTPWSTLAGQSRIDDQRRTVIELAQQAYLPKKVHYYVKGTEPGLDALARSFGVSRRELCEWNGLRGTEVLVPGSCLVFYKRSFELEPVHLAQSLQPSLALESPQFVRLASLNTQSIREIGPPLRPAKLNESQDRESRTGAITCKVQEGDTLWRIAQRHKVDLKTLCKMNGFGTKTIIHPGQEIKLVGSVPFEKSVHQAAKGPASSTKASRSKAPSKVHMVKAGESLWAIAKKYKTTTQAVCQANGLSSKSTLQPGMKINIP